MHLYLVLGGGISRLGTKAESLRSALGVRKLAHLPRRAASQRADSLAIEVHRWRIGTLSDLGGGRVPFNALALRCE